MTLLFFPSENTSRNPVHIFAQTLEQEKLGDAVDCLKECIEVLETISNPEYQSIVKRFILKINQMQQEIQVIKMQTHGGEKDTAGKRLFSFPEVNKSRNLAHKRSKTLAYEKLGDAFDCLKECIEVLETANNPEYQSILVRLIRKIFQTQQEIQVVKSQAHVTEYGATGMSDSIFNLSMHAA